MIEHRVELFHLLEGSEARDPQERRVVLVEDDDNPHPEFEFLFQSLYEEVVRVGDVASEFPLIYDTHVLLGDTRAGCTLLEVLDTVAHFLQKYLERVLYRLVRGHVYSAAKLLYQVGRLEHDVVIPLGIVNFDP